MGGGGGRYHMFVIVVGVDQWGRSIGSICLDGPVTHRDQFDQFDKETVSHNALHISNMASGQGA